MQCAQILNSLAELPRAVAEGDERDDFRDRVVGRENQSGRKGTDKVGPRVNLNEHYAFDLNCNRNPMPMQRAHLLLSEADQIEEICGRIF